MSDEWLKPALGYKLVGTYSLMSCGFFATSGRELKGEREREINDISTLKVFVEINFNNK